MNQAELAAKTAWRRDLVRDLAANIRTARKYLQGQRPAKDRDERLARAHTVAFMLVESDPYPGDERVRGETWDVITFCWGKSLEGDTGIDAEITKAIESKRAATTAPIVEPAKPSPATPKPAATTTNGSDTAEIRSMERTSAPWNPSMPLTQRPKPPATQPKGAPNAPNGTPDPAPKAPKARGPRRARPAAKPAAPKRSKKLSSPLEQPEPKPKRQTRQQIRAQQQPPSGRRLDVPVSLRDLDAWGYRVLASEVGIEEAKIAWCIVLHLNRKEGYARPSLSTIERETGIDRRHVFRGIAGLKDLGLIEVISGGRAKGGRGRANEYWPLLAIIGNGANTAPFTNVEPHAEVDEKRDEKGANRVQERVPQHPENSAKVVTPTSLTSTPQDKSQPSAIRRHRRAMRASGVVNDFLDDHAKIIGMMRSAIKRPLEQRKRLLEKIQAEYPDDTIEHVMDCLKADGTIDEAYDAALADIRQSIEREASAPSAESSTPAPPPAAPNGAESAPNGAPAPQANLKAETPSPERAEAQARITEAQKAQALKAQKHEEELRRLAKWRENYRAERTRKT